MNTMTNIDTTAGVSRAAVLVSLTVSAYTGRKKDRRTQDEVQLTKGAASRNAASVYKSLFADCKELEAIAKHQSRVRADHYRLTLPWSDSGLRMLPATVILEHSKMIYDAKQECARLVDAFLDRYDVLVAAAAFQLGSLFDRTEYPSREQVRRKFGIESKTFPMPTAGDFRLDIETAVQEDLRRKFDQQMQEAVQDAMRSAWERLHTALTNLSDRLGVDEQEDGTVKKRVFRESLVSNALDVCDVLKHLNITNDAALEQARQELRGALDGVETKDLRESEGTRAVTKQSVDKILSKFEWLDMGVGDGV